MKFFTKKSFTNKFIISIISITLLNFCITPFVSPVKAEDGDIFGGKLMGMVRDFVRDFADVAASLVQFGLTGEWIYAVDVKGTGIPDDQSKYWIKQEKFRYPKLQISPEVIFANQVEMLDVNFIRPPSDNPSQDYLLPLQDQGPLRELRSIVSGWYVTLRTIAVVGLLSVLIYVGIRIIISSTSADKAKYKQRLVDWLIAFCLLFFMHYIMAAAVTVVEKVNDMLADVVNINEGIPLQEEYGGVKYDCDDGSGNLDIDDYQESYTELRKKAIIYMTQVVGGTEPTSIDPEWVRTNTSGGTWGATGFWSRHITFGDTTYTMREYTENFAGKIKYRYTYKVEGIFNEEINMDFSQISDNDIPQSGSNNSQSGVELTSSGVKTTIDNRYWKTSYKIYRWG